MKTNQLQLQEPTLSPIEQLRRATLASFLWDTNFTENGFSIEIRIANLVKQCSLEEVCELAIEAREKMNLRSVPILLLREACRKERAGELLGKTIRRVIQRPDEIHKLLELYWKNGKQPLTRQLKLGLAQAFRKFNAYSFAKYRKGDKVNLRDVMFMTHPRPVESSGHQTREERRQGVTGTLTRAETIFKQIAEDTLPTPDTWEVALSSGADKKETFERLLREGNLGYLALLRNLRNMRDAGVSQVLVTDALMALKGAERVLPFRFFAAEEALCAAPGQRWGAWGASWSTHSFSVYKPWLEEAFLAKMQSVAKLPGRTIIIVDISGSMAQTVSDKTQISRSIAAASLASIARELCEESVIYATAGNDTTRKHSTKKIPESRGISLVQDIWAMSQPLGGGGIFLKQVMDFIAKEEPNGADRTIVFTDEQDCGRGEDRPENAVTISSYNYIMNVAAHVNGINNTKWTKINGFSESIFDYVRELEEADRRHQAA